MPSRPHGKDRIPPLKIIRTLALLALTRIGLRWLGFTRLHRYIGHLSARRLRKGSPTGPSLARARRAAQTVSRINREYSLFGSSCLEESLFLWGLLRSRGIPADFRIGVRTLTGPFESHAWVELDGIALNDIDTVGQIYTPIDIGQRAAGGHRP